MLEPLSAWREEICPACGKFRSVHDRFGASCPTCDERTRGRYRVRTLPELLGLSLQPREELLSPWLREKDLSMVYAPRGIGKTFFALGVGFAVASGGEFLRWKAKGRAGVLYVDGEMPTVTIQERLAEMARASTVQVDDVDLRLLSADDQESALPSLSAPEGREGVDKLIEHHGPRLLILDNLSTLMGATVENDADSWEPIQGWLLSLRRQGVAVLLVHHSGKSGQGQRGSSKREDVLDSVISLQRPTDYEATEGARFEVRFTKARGLCGEATASFEATLAQDPHGYLRWTFQGSESRRFERAAAMYEDGASPAAVAIEVGVSRATAYRYRVDWQKGTSPGPSRASHPSPLRGGRR